MTAKYLIVESTYALFLRQIIFCLAPRFTLLTYYHPSFFDILNPVRGMKEAEL